jgi:hypothetical protein
MSESTAAGHHTPYSMPDIGWPVWQVLTCHAAAAAMARNLLFESFAADVTCFIAFRVRAAYKAVQNPKELQKELPHCALGSLLLTWIKQVRCGDVRELCACEGCRCAVPTLSRLSNLLWQARLCHCTAVLCSMRTDRQELCHQFVMSKQCVVTQECVVTLTPFCWDVGHVMACTASQTLNCKPLP